MGSPLSPEDRTWSSPTTARRRTNQSSPAAVIASFATLTCLAITFWSRPTSYRPALKLFGVVALGLYKVGLEGS